MKTYVAVISKLKLP